MRIIIGDTETTGLPPEYKCCEIAWMEVDDNLNILQSHSSLIDPQVPIPPEVSKIHGIYDKDVWTAPTLAEYKEHYGSRVEGPVCLIAHKVDFDKPFFEEVFDVQQTFCTLALSRYALPTAKNHKLQTLREILQIKSDGLAHTAEGDLDVLRQMLIKLIPGSTRGVRQFLNTPVRMLSIMPFGEHKGKPISMIPNGYREHVLTFPDLHPDLRYTLEQLRGI